jgi:DHA1 family arabinose polymer transporter-like MFS transporter
VGAALAFTGFLLAMVVYFRQIQKGVTEKVSRYELVSEH